MDNLDDLLNQPGIWRAGERQRETGLEHITSGFPELDAALPGDGWPLGALTEVLHDHTGIGELSLFMPTLARLSRRGQWLALIAPPYLPYAPALAGHGVDLSRLLLIHPGTATDALWTVEQVLRSGTCAAVLAWPHRADARSLRRLQLAAGAGRSLGLLFRPQASGTHPSPAALRVGLKQHKERALIKLLKCRGARAGQELIVNLSLGGQPGPNPAPSTELAITDLTRRSAPRARHHAVHAPGDRHATAGEEPSLAPSPRLPGR